MAKKKRKTEDRSAADYYKLKTDAVERLVNAENAPKVSDEEINKYTSKRKFRIHPMVKVTFIKFWFSGAVCYFFLWGLGIYIQGLDLMAALAIGLGAVTDLMANKLLRAIEPEEGAYDRWIMVTVRKFWSIFINVLYSGAVLYCVFRTYYVINTLLGVDPDVGYFEAETMVGVEPVLFGLLYLAFDMLFITIKNTFIKIIRDAEAKTSGGKK